MSWISGFRLFLYGFHAGVHWISWIPFDLSSFHAAPLRLAKWRRPTFAHRPCSAVRNHVATRRGDQTKMHPVAPFEEAGGPLHGLCPSALWPVAAPAAYLNSRQPPLIQARLDALFVLHWCRMDSATQFLDRPHGWLSECLRPSVQTRHVSM